ncbi:hypothetical protein M514_17189 [Trichuris suis]|uniref:Uncharacterized protein n=1 Tax=Trichuris suis TaxID=68888 RepID=A0A085NMM1_9BILA|nr:hypothetical protein M514_17189 [Trichuris suis]KHJ43783.1 hypothetical protein D918_06306 [Trichuris suis]
MVGVQLTKCNTVIYEGKGYANYFIMLYNVEQRTLSEAKPKTIAAIYNGEKYGNPLACYDYSIG